MTTDIHVGKVLGNLERDVMEIVWRAKEPISVSGVLNNLNRKKNKKYAYTTIMTIMVRLTDKGLLKRKTVAGKTYFIYQPVYSKEIFLAGISRQFIKNVMNSFGHTAIAYFAEELNKIEPKNKKKLLKILNKAKNER